MIAYCPSWRTSPSIWNGSQKHWNLWQKNKSRPKAALVVGWRLDKSILPRGGGFGNDYERNCSGGTNWTGGCPGAMGCGPTVCP